VDLAEAFTADDAPVDLLQIALEELAAAARGTPSGNRADNRRPDTHGLSCFTVGGDRAIGPVAAIS
jgi:hypothetical protein